MNYYSISQLAKSFGLSRSTLLYYDKIGLLCATERTLSGYRRYSQKDHDRLERICMFRSTGLPLADVNKILVSETNSGTGVLETRLQELGDEILALRVQQQLITAMLKNMNSDKFASAMNKQTWIEMLKSAGMDESAMQCWHADFEARSPQTHSDFLLSLGISKEEAEKIQTWSRELSRKSPPRKKDSI